MLNTFFLLSKISDWDFCGDSLPACDKGKAGAYLDLSFNFKSKNSPAEVDDDDRKKAKKPAVCNDDKDDDKDDQDDKNDDDDDDDDCPIIYDMGGDSEMLLNRGVSYITVCQCIRSLLLGFVIISFKDVLHGPKVVRAKLILNYASCIRLSCHLPLGCYGQQFFI